MQTYRYRPTRFYALCFALTWGNWLLALLFGEGPLLLVFMVLGLFSPAALATATVLCSNSPALKADFRRKLLGFYRLRPGQILLAVLSFAAVTAAIVGVVGYLIGKLF